MTYDELNSVSAGWGFEMGSIAGDIVNNAKWGDTKAAYKKAKVTDQEIEKLMFWAKRYGVDLKVSLDIAFSSANDHRFAAATADSN